MNVFAMFRLYGPLLIKFRIFRCKYSVSKSFRQDDIFGLICRVLSVTGSVLQKCVQTNDILSLTANIPELHSSAFDTLQAVIIW